MEGSGKVNEMTNQSVKMSVILLLLICGGARATANLQDIVGGVVTTLHSYRAVPVDNKDEIIGHLNKLLEVEQPLHYMRMICVEFEILLMKDVQQFLRNTLVRSDDLTGRIQDRESELQELKSPQTKLQELKLPQTKLQELKLPQTKLQELKSWFTSSTKRKQLDECARLSKWISESDKLNRELNRDERWLIALTKNILLIEDFFSGAPNPPNHTTRISNLGSTSEAPSVSDSSNRTRSCRTRLQIP